MSNMWSEFDKKFDNEQLKKDINDAKKNDYPEVPAGTYVVSVVSMEPKVAKTGNPMCSIQFKILEGKYRNSRLFYNQVVNAGYGIHNNNDFLKSMQLDCIDNLGDHIYQNMEQYADLIMDAAEEIDEAGLTFELEYPGKESWPSDWKITDVFEG